VSMQTFRFELGELPPEAEALRTEVREFLRQELGDAPPVRRAHSWGGFDREFSKKMGARGWIAMTWPKRYGGHEKSALERSCDSAPRRSARNSCRRLHAASSRSRSG